MGQECATARGQVAIANSLETTVAMHCIHGSTLAKLDSVLASPPSWEALHTFVDLSNSHCRSMLEEFRMQVWNNKRKT